MKYEDPINELMQKNSEDSVIKKLLKFADSLEDVRLVLMNGSRVNINAPSDIMQDYDVVFFVENMESYKYKKDQSWISQFGELVMFQQNDINEIDENGYIFLLQYKDIRIDLYFRAVEEINKAMEQDSLTQVLMDKDQLIYSRPVPDDSGYHVKKPSEKEWDQTFNEFWWIQTYVAKGIWRDEMPLVKYMYDVILMDTVRRVISWHIGNQYNWKINTGKCGKWFNQLLEPELYNRYVSLYTTADYEETWGKMGEMCDFIREIGKPLSLNLGYIYPEKEDINVTQYVDFIKNIQ